MSTKQDNAKLNREIIGAVEEAISACHECYRDKAKSFAMILNDLESMLLQFQTKMQLNENETYLSQSAQNDLTQDKESGSLNEKLVYVRIFHKDMKNLASPTASLAFIRPLLESIKMADKHGLAVYATEEDVKKSMKGEGYAYAILRIRPEQDITESRGHRTDPQLGCPLMSITNIHISNILKLNHQGVEYLIRDSVIIRPNEL